MDLQKQKFSKLIASQFEYLKTSDSFNEQVKQRSKKLEFLRSKLHDFCRSVIDSLVIPRFKIVKTQFGKRSSIEHVAGNIFLHVSPTPEHPLEASLKLHYEVFLPAKSIKFSYCYQITTHSGNLSSDEWIRFTIPDFAQSEFCKWLEEGFVRFVNSMMSSPNNYCDV